MHACMSVWRLYMLAGVCVHLRVSGGVHVFSPRPCFAGLLIWTRAGVLGWPGEGCPQDHRRCLGT